MGSLYVGDLQPNVDEQDLHQIFTKIGEITSIHLCIDKDTKSSLGYAYVNYLHKEHAKEALNTLNFWNIKGKNCRIMWSKSDRESKKTGNGNLFVKKLDKKLTSKDLHNIFSQFGNVLSCKVAVNSSGESLGYGYVDFQRAEQAERAIAEGNRMSVNGKIIEVSYFVAKGNRQTRPNIVMNHSKSEQINQRNQDTKFSENKTILYIKSLEKHLTDAMLEAHFKRFGRITSVKIKRDQNNISKGFGFVCFLRAEDASVAITAMHGTCLDGKHIYVGYAQRKTERREILSRKLDVAATGKEASSNPSSTIPANLPNLRIGLERNDNFNNVQVGGISRPAQRHSTSILTNVSELEHGTFERPLYNKKSELYELPTSVPTYKPKAKSTSEIQANEPLTNLKHNSQRSKSVGRDELKSMDPSQQKVILGATLFPIIFKLYPNHAFEIVARMINELEVDDIIETLPHQENLKFKINETFFKIRKDTQFIMHETEGQERALKNMTQEKQRHRSELTYKFSSHPQGSVSVHKSIETIRGIHSTGTDDDQKHRLRESLLSIIKTAYPNSYERILDKLLELDRSKLENILANNGPLKEIEEIIKDLFPKRVRYLSETKYVTEEKDLKVSSELKYSERKENTPKYKQKLSYDDENDNDDVFMSIRSVGDKIFEAAKENYPNEANFIVKAITENCSEQELNWIADSKLLMKGQIEKWHLKSKS